MHTWFFFQYQKLKRRWQHQLPGRLDHPNEKQDQAPVTLLQEMESYNDYDGNPQLVTSISWSHTWMRLLPHNLCASSILSVDICRNDQECWQNNWPSLFFNSSMDLFIFVNLLAISPKIRFFLHKKAKNLLICARTSVWEQKQK